MEKVKNDSISSVLSDVKTEQKRKENLGKPVTSSSAVQVEEAKNLLYVNLKALCDEPQHVVVCETTTPHSVIFEITVAKDDIGKVIGKQGANAMAVRRLLYCLGLKYRRQFRMEIVEND